VTASQYGSGLIQCKWVFATTGLRAVSIIINKGEFSAINIAIASPVKGLKNE